jgi:hypothetical protein
MVVEMVRGGWPQVISGLKTLLETGDPLPPSPDGRHGQGDA